MALTKETEQDQIEIVGPYKLVQVRTATIVKEDGVEISRTYHRHVVEPNISDADLANESSEVQAICATMHTQSVKDAYAAALAADPAINA